MRAAMRGNAELLATMAQEETGLGRAEDKVKKNLLVIDKTPGPEILQPSAWTGDRGLTLVERAPYGVFGVITPSTNPTSTIINNAIGLVSAGNAAVFNVHPGAKRVSAYQIQLLNRAIVAAGGPPDLLTAPAEPTVESAQALMKHPGIRILLITGGGAVVKLAMTSGKRAICAGPGNPPVVVDETADIDLAGRADRLRRQLRQQHHLRRRKGSLRRRRHRRQAQGGDGRQRRGRAALVPAEGAREASSSRSSPARASTA